MNPRRTPRRFRAVEERFIAGNRVKLLRDGTEAFPAMLDAMVQHRNELLVVMAATQHAQQRALTTVVADAIADGELPAGTDRLEVMRQLMGPLPGRATPVTRTTGRTTGSPWSGCPGVSG